MDREQFDELEELIRPLVNRIANSLGRAVIERVNDAGDLWTLDPIPLLVALGERRAAGDDVGDLCAQFHESIASTTADVVRGVADHTGIATVVLSGGVFQNARLLSSVVRRLESHILEPLVPRQLPQNNGGVSYGQAVVAAARLARDTGE